jgi:hypothetical protein
MEANGERYFPKEGSAVGWMGERYEELEALKAIFGEELKEINQVVKKKNNKKKKE